MFRPIPCRCDAAFDENERHSALACALIILCELRAMTTHKFTRDWLEDLEAQFDTEEKRYIAHRGCPARWEMETAEANAAFEAWNDHADQNREPDTSEHPYYYGLPDDLDERLLRE